MTKWNVGTVMSYTWKQSTDVVSIIEKGTFLLLKQVPSWQYSFGDHPGKRPVIASLANHRAEWSGL